MVDPQAIFQEPDKYIQYLTSASEGQYFDRKEVWNDSKEKLKEACKSIKETISAFANARGGLLIIGINDDGVFVGLDHLKEEAYNQIANALELVGPHRGSTKEWYHGNKKLLLFWIPQGEGVCQAEDRRAWKRQGANNIELTEQDRERLIIERRTQFEDLSCCEYDATLLNESIFNLFRKAVLENRGSKYEYDTFDFLYKVIGACKIENGKRMFTNAGILFFANNPRAFLPSAAVRILKYDSHFSDYQNPGSAIFDREYDGCIPELLMKIRAFVNGDNAFFKRYSFRNPNGSGIIEEPEYPLVAVEETIINAIIHRNYNSPQLVTCVSYRDAFVVRSSGGIQQSSHLPTEFKLNDVILETYPRNPKIVSWATEIRDDNKEKFVLRLSEGTNRMREAMQRMNLPSPTYHTNGYTTVALYNNSQEREAVYKQLSSIPQNTEYANLFKINILYKDQSQTYSLSEIRKEALGLLKDKLQNNAWFIDRDKTLRFTAHRRGNSVSLPQNVANLIRIFPAYSFQFYIFDSQFYLSIDYDVQLKNIVTLDILFQKGIKDLRNRSAQIKLGGVWTHGVIQDFTEYYARVFLPEFEKTEEVLIKNVIPVLSIIDIKNLLQKSNIRFNLDTQLKEISLSNRADASKERSEMIIEQAKYLADVIFPLSYNGFQLLLDKYPLSLLEHSFEQDFIPFSVYPEFKEPKVRFGDEGIELNILSGLVKYGSYTHQASTLEVIPLCTIGQEDNMKELISKLQKGNMNFKGMENVFGRKLTYNGVIALRSADEYIKECERLLNEHPEWVGNRDLNRFFLVYVPEDQYPVSDINSPYFQIKEFLFEKGIPVQMVDTPTLKDPKWKDFNLALNIVAKTGGTPWVLPNALPEADLFIGLSYAQYKDDDELYRTMGYANVFNQYGEWQYYKGNAKAFDYDKKHIYLADLVKTTLFQRSNLSESPLIHIHYSAKFSKEDVIAITAAAKSVKPNCKVFFVWINTSHNIRMFDSDIQGNGSLSRGTYVLTRPNQGYLSTTGYSPLKKTLGTPVMLEVNLRSVDQNGVNIKTVTQHILALTKLNWASTQSVNGEPVTTKYAHQIATLSKVFFRRRGVFKLHEVLEKTAWFL